MLSIRLQFLLSMNPTIINASEMQTEVILSNSPLGVLYEVQERYVRPSGCELVPTSKLLARIS